MIFKSEKIISIRSKFLLLWFVLVIIIGAWVVLSAELLLRQVLQNDLTLRGVAVARDVAARCANAVIANDLHELVQTVTDTMEHNPDFVYLFILDSNNELIIHSEPDLEVSQTLRFLHRGKEMKEYSSAVFRSEAGIVYDVAVPILSGMVGTVRIGLSESNLHRSVVQTRTYLLASILLAFILGTVITFLFTSKMLAPLQQLTEATSAIAAQNFTARVQIESRDEIGRLAAAFNHMVEQLGSFKSENIAHKQELERKDKLRVQLVKRLITAQEEERKRIARELHDEAAQSLTALKLGLKAVEEENPPEKT
ncbi:MAG TPA: HAMP domain-containing protein, partial [Firmicutes bacterium]|nr:HAMP domain-containing protein [Bacillota bacterium]